MAISIRKLRYCSLRRRSAAVRLIRAQWRESQWWALHLHDHVGGSLSAISLLLAPKAAEGKMMEAALQELRVCFSLMSHDLLLASGMGESLEQLSAMMAEKGGPAWDILVQGNLGLPFAAELLIWGFCAEWLMRSAGARERKPSMHIAVHAGILSLVIRVEHQLRSSWNMREWEKDWQRMGGRLAWETGTDGISQLVARISMRRLLHITSIPEITPQRQFPFEMPPSHGY